MKHSPALLPRRQRALLTSRPPPRAARVASSRRAHTTACGAAVAPRRGRRHKYVAMEDKEGGAEDEFATGPLSLLLHSMHDS